MPAPFSSFLSRLLCPAPVLGLFLLFQGPCACTAAPSLLPSEGPLAAKAAEPGVKPSGKPAQRHRRDQAASSKTRAGAPRLALPDGRVLLRTGQKQHYSGSSEGWDTDINSPKSAAVHPDGSKYYVNSLEGCATVVYRTSDNAKLKVIRHTFGPGQAGLWAEPSGLYPFQCRRDAGVNNFSGKPVEMVFTHGGRYLWISYYRRDWDGNAQDPSAVCVVDTATDEIVRLMETGPLPKMLAASPDGRYLAVTHWGANTVGLVDIASPDPKDWRHLAEVAVGERLNLCFRGGHVNRDRYCGSCLRGTVFTPDSSWLLVGRMSGSGIAAINVEERAFRGILGGGVSNIRHLAIHGDMLYASVNVAGYVLRIPLATVLGACAKLEGGSVSLSGWERVKTGAGTRTIVLSPDGKFVFAACNSACTVDVLSTQPFRRLGSVPANRYPVGLGISPDGSRLYVTSQGKQGSGGQAMGIYRICTHTGLAGLWAAKQARRLAAAASKDAGNRKDEAGRSEGTKGSQTPVAAPSPAQAPARQDSQAPESKTPGDATSGQSRDRVDAGGSEGSKESRTPAAEASPAQLPAGQGSQAPESKTPESKTPGHETSGQSRDRDQQGSAPQTSVKEAWPGERPAEGMNEGANEGAKER